jgi:Kazal-type serine protease inhibitor domain
VHRLIPPLMLVSLGLHCGARSDLAGETNGCSLQPTCTTDLDCEKGTVCFVGPNDCATVEPLGFCTDISSCTGTGPVCGCNNQTFASVCAALRAGQPIATMASCVLPCGSSSDPCPEDQFCDFGMLGTCPDEGVEGVCLERPTSCETGPSAPVCGCNDQTFDTPCLAELAGVNVFAEGPCTNPSRPDGQRHRSPAGTLDPRPRALPDAPPLDPAGDM